MTEDKKRLTTIDENNIRGRIEQKLVSWGMAQPGLDAHRYAGELTALVQSVGEDKRRAMVKCAADVADTATLALGRLKHGQPVIERARELINATRDIGAETREWQGPNGGALGVFIEDDPDEGTFELNDVADELHALGKAVDVYNEHERQRLSKMN